MDKWTVGGWMDKRKKEGGERKESVKEDETESDRRGERQLEVAVKVTVTEGGP